MGNEICECPRCGRLHHKMQFGTPPASISGIDDKAKRAIEALREPHAAFARVPNTIRQAYADLIEDLANRSVIVDHTKESGTS